MYPGRCLCGAVRYEVDGGIVAVVNCHCSMCRKHHGTPYATWVVVPSRQYRVTQGAASIVRYQSSPGLHRSFCSHCGSVVPETTPDSTHVAVPAGNLDVCVVTPQSPLGRVLLGKRVDDDIERPTANGLREQTVVELIAAWENGTPLAAIRGITWRDGARVHANRTRPPIQRPDDGRRRRHGPRADRQGRAYHRW